MLELDADIGSDAPADRGADKACLGQDDLDQLAGVNRNVRLSLEAVLRDIGNLERVIAAVDANGRREAANLPALRRSPIFLRTSAARPRPDGETGATRWIKHTVPNRTL